jgi:WhiB family redox-sensing transcriptional regulator
VSTDLFDGDVPAHPIADGMRLVLLAALEDRGPAPCQSSPVPQAWDFDGAASRGLAVLAVEGCMSCPVRGECLVYALAAGERHGIWGGLTPPERETLSRDVAS